MTTTTNAERDSGDYKIASQRFRWPLCATPKGCNLTRNAFGAASRPPKGRSYNPSTFVEHEGVEMTTTTDTEHEGGDYQIATQRFRWPLCATPKGCNLTRNAFGAASRPPKGCCF